jgi:hypothetical protein
MLLEYYTDHLAALEQEVAAVEQELIDIYNLRDRSIL